MVRILALGAALWGSSDPSSQQLFSEIIEVLAYMFGGLPVSYYFEDIGFPVTAGISANGERVLSEFSGRRAYG